jgi:hypothetical protein
VRSRCSLEKEFVDLDVGERVCGDEAAMVAVESATIAQPTLQGCQTALPTLD